MEGNFNTKHLLWIIPIVFILMLGSWMFGYYEGYTLPELNLENGILFCQSQGQKMCSQNSTIITCANRCSLNDDLTLYRNPELTIKDFRFGIRENG